MGNASRPPGSSWPSAPKGPEGRTEHAQEQTWADPPGGGSETPPGGRSAADRGVWAWPPPRPVRTSQFTPAEIPGGEFYHRLGRTRHYRWWTLPLTLLAFAVLLFFLGVGVALATTLVSVLGGNSLISDSPLSAIGQLAFGLLSVALLAPIVLFLVRVVQWRRTGTLLSVEGRVRWRWLGLCTALAIPPAAVCAAAFLLLAELLRPELVPNEDAGGKVVFAAVMAVVLLLVPFQTAAEEITTRGLFMQMVGALGPRPGEPGGDGAAARVLRSPATAVTASGVLFAAVYAATHPGDLWTTASLAVFGLAMSWLTWYTGGLEAAIGLHMVAGLIQFTLCAFEGRTAEIGTGAVVGAGLPLGSGTPLVLLLTFAQTALYAIAVLWAARRRNVRRVSARS